MAVPERRNGRAWFAAIIAIGVVVAALYVFYLLQTMPRTHERDAPLGAGGVGPVLDDGRLAALEPSPVATVANDPALVHLTRKLRQAGVRLTSIGPVRDSFARPTGHEYRVSSSLDGGWLSLYPYRNSEALRTDVRKIPRDAQIGIYDWAATPNFFRCGTVMTLYQGRDRATVRALTRLCGEPFATGSVRSNSPGSSKPTTR